MHTEDEVFMLNYKFIANARVRTTKQYIILLRANVTINISISQPSKVYFNLATFKPSKDYSNLEQSLIH